MQKNSLVFIGLILGLVLGGCSVSKRASWHVERAERLDPSIFKLDTIINETIVFKLDTVVKLDTNISIVLPRDTVTIEKLIPISRNFDKVVKKQGIITTEAEAIKGILKINSYLDSSFFYNLQTEIKIKNAKITRLNREIVSKGIIIQEKNKKLNKLQKTIKLIGIWFVVIMILLIVFRLLKKK